MASNPWSGWVWPVPINNSGSKPVISDGFGATKRGGKGHYGCDLMYKRQTSGEARPPELSRGFAMPSMAIPALACGPGTIHQVNLNDSHGISIIVDHHNVPGIGPRVSAYRHLSTAFVKKGDTVFGGTPLGYIGYDLTQGKAGLNHLHFELWDTSKSGGSNPRVDFGYDPAIDLAKWPMRKMDGTEVRGGSALVAGLPGDANTHEGSADDDGSAAFSGLADFTPIKGAVFAL